jgi:hypothetical protein
VARARLVEASALSELAVNPSSTNPGPQEARLAAAQIAGELGGASSAFGPIERARALEVLGSLYQTGTQLEEADARVRTGAGHLCE